MPALEPGREDCSSKDSNTSPRDALQPPQIPAPNVHRTSLDANALSQWNTAKLGLRVGADLISAAGASCLIAPVICVIDRYVQARAGRDVIYKDFKMRVSVLGTWKLSTRPYFGVYPSHAVFGD